jgi:hypothetical protein
MNEPLFIPGHTLDPSKLSHRRLIYRAEMQLLSEGMSEEEAKLGKFKRAIRNWDTGEDQP